MNSGLPPLPLLLWCQLYHYSSNKKTSNIEKGLLQMQHLLVCLQGTVGDHTGGINKDCKQLEKRETVLLTSFFTSEHMDI